MYACWLSIQKNLPVPEVLGHKFRGSRNDGNRSECSRTELLLVLLVIIRKIRKKFSVPNVNRKIVFGMKRSSPYKTI